MPKRSRSPEEASANQNQLAALRAKLARIEAEITRNATATNALESHVPASWNDVGVHTEGKLTWSSESPWVVKDRFDGRVDEALVSEYMRRAHPVLEPFLVPAVILVRPDGTRAMAQTRVRDAQTLTEFWGDATRTLDDFRSVALQLSVLRMLLEDVHDVCHCDLHSDNVLVERATNQVRVIDWGMARADGGCAGGGACSDRDQVQQLVGLTERELEKRSS